MATERKGASYKITSRKPAYTGTEHHQRTQVSEMYERMLPMPSSSLRSGGTAIGGTHYRGGRYIATKSVRHG